MAITLLRHTLPKIDLNTCYGRQDVDVADTFADEAAISLSKLRQPSKIVSSPLMRCRKLAGYFADTFDMTYSIDNRLQEMDFGSWEGQYWHEIPASELEAWRGDFLHANPHHGETVHTLNERVALVIDEYRTMPESILLVTHAGVIKSARFLVNKNKSTFDWSESIGFGDHLEL